MVGEKISYQIRTLTLRTSHTIPASFKTKKNCQPLTNEKENFNTKKITIFPKISRVLERIRKEHIEQFTNLETILNFLSICSIRFFSRKRKMIKKNDKLQKNKKCLDCSKLYFTHHTTTLFYLHCCL